MKPHVYDSVAQEYVNGDHRVVPQQEILNALDAIEKVKELIGILYKAEGDARTQLEKDVYYNLRIRLEEITHD